MSFGGWELIVILVIILLLFGTKRVRSIGKDLGEALKSFKKAVKDDEEHDKDKN